MFKLRSLSPPAVLMGLMLIAAVALAGCDGASAGSNTSTPTPADSTPSPTSMPSGGDGAIPPDVEEDGDVWVLPQKDYAGTRANLDAEIDSSNVNDLGVAWSFALPGMSQYGAAAAIPVVADGVVYYQDLRSNVFAFDLESGEMLWEKEYDEFNLGPNGPAFGYGKVFVISSVTTVTALDAETGEEVWTRELDLAETEGMDIQPIVYDGMVYISTVPGRSVEQFYSGNATGVIHALDAETGESVWTFDTVDSEDIWGNPEVNSGGGAWFPPSIDTERGLILWGVGNPAPFPGTEEFPSGSSRPGPNLYTNSIIALDHRTGELEWYTQVLPHDIFDHDFQNTPILTTANYGGQEYDVAIGSGKNGEVIAFDMETGSIIWETNVGQHMNDMVEEIPEGEELEVLPGYFGGVETPKAYADGVVFVPVVNLASTFTGSEIAGAPDFSQGTGELVAINVDTGKVKWQVELPSMALGGATVVNDLVFTATYDGMMYAFDRETGEQVWTFESPAGINAQPAVVGDTIIWGAGVTQDGQPPVLFALRLGADGEIITAPPAGTGTPAPTGTPPGAGTPAPTGTPAGTPSPTGTPSGTPQATGTPSPSGTPSGTPSPGGTPSGTPAPTGTAAPRGTPGAEAVTITLSADNIQFSTDTITVPAGAQVTVEFTNMEAVPHNFSVYDSAARQTEFFVGDVITGPDTSITYEFTAPEEPGTYFFVCDIHPVQMTGEFIVE